MVHGNKIGRAINDEGTKFVKKLINKKPISFVGRYWHEGDIKIEVANIRKYQKSNWSGFVYEVDVKVSFIKNIWYDGSSRKKKRQSKTVQKRKIIERRIGILQY